MTGIADTFNAARQRLLAGQFAEAETLFRQVLKAEPSLPEAHTNLGHVFVRQERFAEAIAEYRLALQLKYDQFDAHYILAIALRDQGQLADAVVHFQQAVRLNPTFADAHSELGGVLRTLGQFDEAVLCCRQALQLNPLSATAHSILGTCLLCLGQTEEARMHYAETARLQPDSPTAESSLLYCLNYDPQMNLQTLFELHCAWGQAPQRKMPPTRHANDPSPERRLRIGYVSPDFRQHAVMRYFEPVLVHHDPEQVEVYCYADVPILDEVTVRLQEYTQNWLFTCGNSDAQIAQRIRDDGIDILVDLAGHSASNRLGLFAHKPAPVQATWFGYMNTTGLTTIDYRLTDENLDPPGQPRLDTEEPWRLPDGLCCFMGPANGPVVTPLPALPRGHLTFGSLHPLWKLNGPVFDLWSQILKQLPTARLLMVRDTLKGSAREHLQRQFVERGIAVDRLDLRAWTGIADYLSVYEEIDVSLDAFPVTGGVTVCESLWMGVPVISLRGLRPAGRNGAALLVRVGLNDWVVDTKEQYAALAVSMANNLESLARLRAGLRERVQTTLGDAGRFTRSLEDAYRSMWRRWCDSQTR